MVNKEIKKFTVIIDSTTITTLVENMITIIENSIIEADSITLIKADSITITTLKKIIQMVIIETLVIDLLNFE